MHVPNVNRAKTLKGNTTPCMVHTIYLHFHVGPRDEGMIRHDRKLLRPSCLSSQYDCQVVLRCSHPRVVNAQSLFFSVKCTPQKLLGFIVLALRRQQKQNMASEHDRSPQATCTHELRVTECLTCVLNKFALLFSKGPIFT